MKLIKNKKQLLSLSAAVLLVVIIMIIVIRRRGRKVEIVEPYRLNNSYDIYLYAEDLDNYDFYRGTLAYVIMPYGWKNKYIETDIAINKNKLYPVIGIGYKLPSGKVKHIKLKETAYIEGFYIGIGEE